MTEKERLLLHAWVVNVTIMFDELTSRYAPDLSESMKELDALATAIVGEEEEENDQRWRDMAEAVEGVMQRKKQRDEAAE